VINSSGGEPRRLTPETEFAGPPNWSGDGHWIYFMLKRTGTYQIWKTTPTGEQLVEVTRNGGFEAQASVDGKFLYYTDVAPGEGSGLQIPVRLMRVPLNGVDETLVVPRIWTFHWSVTEKGIYYLVPGAANRPHQIYRLDGGRSELVGELPGPSAAWTGGFSVSRDGRWLFVSQFDRNDTDLMLIDHFR
jgi:Tol biopolymer transport system component